MVINKKVTGTAASMPAGLALGCCVSLAVTITGAVIAANLILKEVIQESGIGYCSMLILLLSSVLGALTSVKRIKHRRLYVCILSGLIYYGLLLGMTALFFGGQYQGMGVTGLIVLAGCGSVALTGLRKEKSHGQRGRKFPSR